MSNIPLSERAKWVGGSESAALFGLSPYTTRFELWHQKAGNIEPHDLGGDSRVNAGKFLEPSIANWANHEWHWPIINVEEYYRHLQVARMGCSLDFQTVDGLEPVEIKNVDNLIFRDGPWETEGDTILQAPIYFLIQVQHEIACSPLAPSRGWLVVCVGGNRLFRMEVPRHEVTIQRIEREVSDFWASIEANEPPAPDFEADADTIRLLYGGEREFIDLRQNARAVELCEEYREAHEIEKAATKRKKTALAEIQTMMADARMALVGDSYKVTASQIKEATIVRKPYWRWNISKPKEKAR